MGQKPNKYKNCIENKGSIFSVATKAEKDLLLKSYTCTTILKGEKIVKESDRPTSLICLSEGKAKISKKGVGKREQIIRMIKPIEFIGAQALFTGENYLATATAVEDSMICTVSKDILFKILNQNTELSFRFIKLFASELSFSDKRTIALTQKHVRGRIADSLIVLHETYGTETDKQTLKVALSRDDLASLSNMTTSNAIKTLSNFAMERILDVEGRIIKILDFPQLKRISECG